MSLYINGASAADLAAHFGIAREEAREIIHITIQEVSRKYYADR